MSSHSHVQYDSKFLLELGRIDFNLSQVKCFPCFNIDGKFAFDITNFFMPDTEIIFTFRKIFNLKLSIFRGYNEIRMGYGLGNPSVVYKNLRGRAYIFYPQPFYLRHIGSGGILCAMKNYIKIDWIT